MGYPILKDWSAKRSGPAMTITAHDETGKLVMLKAVEIRRDDSTHGKTLATGVDDVLYELA